MTEWRPTLNDLRQARRLVGSHPSARIRRRLKILEALMAAPKATLTIIARQTKTRTRVVRRLLQQWQSDGPDSLVQFGRPSDLSPAMREKLKQTAMTIPLRSITEAGYWLARETGMNFSRPTLRKYCQQAGLELPWKFRPPKPAKPVARRATWTSRQVAELKRHGSELKQRGQAVIQVGMKVNRPLNRIARDCGVPASTLRLDCQRFAQGGVRALLKHRRRENRLERSGVWPAFVSWCGEHWRHAGASPSAKLARNHLRKEHRVHLPVRTIYTYLTRWRQHAGIPLRRHKPRENFSPSDGLAVRAIRV